MNLTLFQKFIRTSFLSILVAAIIGVLLMMSHAIFITAEFTYESIMSIIGKDSLSSQLSHEDTYHITEGDI